MRKTAGRAVWIAALASITACSEVDDGDSSSTGPSACSPDAASLQQNVFTPSCLGSGCHSGDDAAASLDLSAGDLQARLINAGAATCDRTLVVPGNAELSFLYEKIATDDPACGQRMPLGGTLAPFAQECVRAWIAGLDAGCETCGGAGCADLETSPQNCGACGRVCPPNVPCQDGECVCPHGGTICDGACVETATDPAHCGSCDKSCPASQVCSLGDCAASCASGLTDCSSACVDTTSDALDCGDCGVDCGPTGTCVDSHCVCAGGADTQTDPNNCGGCGVTCAPGQTCEAGVCTCIGASVSFAADVQPIFTKHCASNGCHSGQMPQQGLDLRLGKAYAEVFDVAAEQCTDGRARVEPGQPDHSYLLDKMLGVDLCFGTKMPKLSTVPSADIETISNWICAGAPDN